MTLLRTVLLSALLLATGCRTDLPRPGERIGVQLAGRTFYLELATTSEARYQGLSDRKEIAPDGGMLFVFPEDRELVFVMRRCLVPIDLLFLGPGGRVVAMHRMKVEPYDTPDEDLTKYRSGWSARFAIELRGGTLDELDLKPGQKVVLPLEHLKQMAR